METEIKAKVEIVTKEHEDFLWSKREKRFPIELRVGGETSKPTTITGHAAVFNQTTTLWPGVQERIAAGAFVDSIGKDDVRALYNHNADWVLGRNTVKPPAIGSLLLREDETGLYYENIPPDTQDARDLITRIENGLITQNSFAFRAIDDDWDEAPDGTLIRTLTKVKLFDISPVTYPAYAQTDISLRSREEILAEAKRCLAAKAKGRSIKLAMRKLEFEKKRES